MVRIRPPTFGISPQTIRKMAPMVTTWRLITPVMAIRPTFWLNEVLGRPPNIPAIACGTEPVGEGRALDLDIGRFAAAPPPLVIPLTSPTVSTARNEGHQAETDDRGDGELSKPYLNGWGRGEGGGIAPGRADGVKGQLADQQAIDVTHDDTHQHRRHAEHAAGIEFQPQRHEDDDQCRRPAEQRAIAFRARRLRRHAASGVFDPHLDQRQADHGHHKPGDQRRQGETDLADKEAEEGMEEPTQKYAAK